MPGRISTTPLLKVTTHLPAGMVGPTVSASGAGGMASASPTKKALKSADRGRPSVRAAGRPSRSSQRRPRRDAECVVDGRRQVGRGDRVRRRVGRQTVGAAVDLAAPHAAPGQHRRVTPGDARGPRSPVKCAGSGRTRRPTPPASRPADRAGAGPPAGRRSPGRPAASGDVFRLLKLFWCVSQKFCPSWCQLTHTRRTPASISRRASSRHWPWVCRP